MAAQTWNSLQTTLLAATVKAQPPYTISPPDFAALFPQATSYAEERIYTDIPFLGIRTSNSSLTTTPKSRTINLSNMVNMAGGPIIVPEKFFLITPIGATPSAGTRVPFIRSSDFVIDQLWPIEANVQAPSLTSWLNNYWAMIDDHTIIYAPTADAAYTAEITGLYQPTPIGPTNQTTYISTTYPALLEAACMVFLSGYLLHNFNAQGNLPQQAISHEMEYKALMEAAKDEEMRRRGLRPNVPMPMAPQAAGG